MYEIREQAKHYLQFCKYQRGLSYNTIRNYNFDLKFFIQFLLENNFPLFCDQISKKVLESYLESLTKKYKVKTVKRKMACIHAFFTYLEEEEIIENNPFRKFKVRLKEGYRKPRSLTLNEMDHFLQTAYEDEYALVARPVVNKLKTARLFKLKTVSRGFTWCRDVAIMELLFAAGLRVAELCNLRFEDYDEVEHTLHIIGKGNRERYIYLENYQVKKIFKDYLVMRKAVGINLPYIFVTKFHKKMSTQAVRNIITKYAERSGINKKITPHVFRHSFATLLLESGVDIKYIQDFLGHSTIATTQIYLHISDQQKRKVLATKHPREIMHATGF